MTRVLLLSSSSQEVRTIVFHSEGFIKFVEMGGGSISIGEKSYYRHATCMFLTLDDENFQCLQFLHLPAID